MDDKKIHGYIKICVPFNVKDYEDALEKLSPYRVTDDKSFGYALKHIQTALSVNAICAECKPEDIFGNSHSYGFLSGIEIFLFETNIGIVAYKIELTGDDYKPILSECKKLRDTCPDESGVAVNKSKNWFEFSDYALKAFFGEGCVEVSHYSSCAAFDRVRVYSAFRIADKDADINRITYLLCNSYEERGELIKEQSDTSVYNPHDYLSWAFSKRGVAAIGKTTDDEKNNKFVHCLFLNRTYSGYFKLYILALHQKYAIYNFLNEIAHIKRIGKLRKYQEELIKFNTKYVYRTVSDEYFYQKVYGYMVESMDIRDAYNDLDDELQRVINYSELMQNSNINRIASLFSLICAISAFTDTYSFFSDAYGLTMPTFTGAPTIFWVLISVETLGFFAGLFFFVKSFGKNRLSK